MSYPSRPVSGDPLVQRLLAEHWRATTAVVGCLLIVPPLLVAVLTTVVAAALHPTVPGWLVLAHAVGVSIPVVWVAVWFGGPGAWPPERWHNGFRAVLHQAGLLVAEAPVYGTLHLLGVPEAVPELAGLPLVAAVGAVLLVLVPMVASSFLAQRLAPVRRLELAESDEPLDLYTDMFPGADVPGIPQLTLEADALVWRLNRQPATRRRLGGGRLRRAFGDEEAGRIPLRDITDVRLARLPDHLPPYPWFTVPGRAPLLAEPRDALVLTARGSGTPIWVPTTAPEADLETLRRRLYHLARAPHGPLR